MTDVPQFDRYATSYDSALNSALSVTGDNSAFYAESRIALLAELVCKISQSKISSILDFGCGTGSATPFFREYFDQPEIVGVDVSSESVAVARERFNQGRTNFHVLQSQEAESIKNIDLVFVNGVFHHIPPHERDGWLKWIYQRLEPNGLLALFENNPWNIGTRFVMARCEFDEDAICLSPLETSRRMRRAEFEILAVRHLLFFPAFLRFLRPMEPHLRRIPLGGQYVCLGRK